MTCGCMLESVITVCVEWWGDNYLREKIKDALLHSDACVDCAMYADRQT